MKATKALKKINKALDHDMDQVILLGEDHGNLVELVVGDAKMFANLIMNYFNDNPDVRHLVIDALFYQKLKEAGEKLECN